VASVLLAARRAGSEAWAALNIRYDEDIIDGLEGQGLVTAEFDAEYADLDGAIESALADTPEADVLYQRGGFGVEPIVYLLAPDAPTATERVRTLLPDG
ncbi:MAG: thiamine-phosphate synthase family protein, partial [Halobacteriales archaeon]|nr:thiamine-phosphate synthase family protein [Halobacteriales archaeon]